MTEILNISNLTTGYQNANNRTLISKDINLAINSSSFIALLGPNGCGKSTLLHTIAGLQKPISGSISIQNKQLHTLKGKEKARQLSLVLTDKITSAYLIVEDIVSMGRYPHIGSMGILSEKDKAVVEQSINKCALSDYKQRRYSELSDGEKQRVMLARALAQDTPLMMLDEPTAHLDLPNRVILMKMLRNLSKEMNKAILLSTHELDLALQWCDAIWLMNKDGDIANGVPEDLVINGAFSDVFSSDEFYFDISTGIFKMKQKYKGSIYIKGNPTIKEWVRRAIERHAYKEASSESDTNIVINIQSNGQLQITNNTETAICNNIEELLKILSNIAV